MAVKVKATKRRVAYGYKDGQDENGRPKVKNRTISNIASEATADQLYTLGTHLQPIIGSDYLSLVKTTSEVIVNEPA